jgi:oligopeptide/dipeptide ABC transporter ATP-binding protein
VVTKFFEIKNLVVNFKTFEGVKNTLNIDYIGIEKGKTYGLVGESGAGKTVLALTIQRLLAVPPGIIESGEILLDGEDLLKKKETEMRLIRGKKIAMIFQDPMSTLNPVFTVGEQLIRIITHNQGLKRNQAREKALEIIKTVKLPDPANIMVKYPHELSGGQRQRIIIAMALVCGAELIIADEPTRNLDVTIQAGILKLIKELQDKFKVTVLFIANNLGLVSAVCDEIGILKEGQIVERGYVREVLSNPSHEYTKLLINSITPKQKKEVKPENGQPCILEVKGLKKYYSVGNRYRSRKGLYVKAVDGVDFAIKQGEVLGIVGESGCGKSTLVNTIMLLEKPTEGTVIFNEQKIFSLNKRELRKARKNVQIVFQDPFWSLNPRWMVKEIIGEPLRVHEKLPEEMYLEKVQNMLETVGLPRSAAFEYPYEFSGGQRQRIAIARALSVNPKLVVLDEPTSAIDVVSQSQILNMLENLKKKMDLTYIIISHDLSVVNYMADKIIVMYLGKIVEYGTSSIIFNTPKHPYTVALFNSIPDLMTKSVDELTSVKGEIPSAINPPAGCRFHPRCDKCMEICKTESPDIVEVEGRYVACHLFQK